MKDSNFINDVSNLVISWIKELKRIDETKFDLRNGSTL
jgi:hypothetical protein